MHPRIPRPSRSAVLPALAALSLVCACSSPEEKKVIPLTPEAELPATYREAWRAWYEEAEEWPALREEVQADPRLAAFIVDNLVRVMVRFYDHAGLAERGQLPGHFERAQRELVYFAPHSAPVCTELALVGDGPVSFLAGDVLNRIDDPRWTLPVAGRLGDDEARVRRRAARLLETLPYSFDEEEQVWELLARAALEDEDWSVRAQAVGSAGARAIRQGRLEHPREILCGALGDSDEEVARIALRSLATTRDSLAMPAVIDLLERLEREGGSLATAREAQKCLLAMTGETDQRDVVGWRRWWRENHP